MHFDGFLIVPSALGSNPMDSNNLDGDISVMPGLIQNANGIDLDRVEDIKTVDHTVLNLSFCMTFSWKIFCC